MIVRNRSSIGMHTNRAAISKAKVAARAVGTPSYSRPGGTGFVAPIRKSNVQASGMYLRQPQVRMSSMSGYGQMPALAENPTFNMKHTGLVPRLKAAQLPGYKRNIGLPNRSDNQAADLLKRMKDKISRGGKLDVSEHNFIQQLATTTGVRR